MCELSIYDWQIDKLYIYTNSIWLGFYARNGYCCRPLVRTGAKTCTALINGQWAIDIKVNTPRKADYEEGVLHIVVVYTPSIIILWSRMDGCCCNRQKKKNRRGTTSIWIIGCYHSTTRSGGMPRKLAFSKGNQLPCAVERGRRERKGIKLGGGGWHGERSTFKSGEQPDTSSPLSFDSFVGAALPQQEKER